MKQKFYSKFGFPKEEKIIKFLPWNLPKQKTQNKLYFGFPK